MKKTPALQCGDRSLDLSHPQVMGVLNVTPDSFSDGGRFSIPDRAIEQALQMVAEGASIIDVGGESTRPGARPISEQEELDRVMPVVLGLVREGIDAVISIDTSSAVVMSEAASVGVGLINDVRSLTRPRALEVAVRSGLPVCLMHMQGSPETMQDAPSYQQHVVKALLQYFQTRIDLCLDAGMKREFLLLDPGFGFGKTLCHNLVILKQLEAFTALGLPILVGLSRKSMIGAILDKPVDQRVFGGLAAAVLAVNNGANIVRTHDVRPTVDALKMVAAVMSSESAP